MGKDLKILVINPGSTSTKIAVYEGTSEILEETIRHEKEDLMKFESIPAQREYRFEEIKRVLNEHNIELEEIDAIAARGGLLKPMASGVYDINEAMVKDLTTSYAALHASCISGLIGYDLKKKYNIPAFIVDPVVVDELIDEARLTGIPQIERVAVFHALNQKAIGKECAKELGKKYEDCNFVIAHMGGGVTIAAHKKGRAIDVNNGVEGEGPFSPERCGAAPVAQVVDLCFEGTMSQTEIKDMCTKTGGMVAHIQTNDLRDAQVMIDNGDKKAKLVVETMAYQVAKQIGAMSAAIGEKIDAIILTGGLAYSESFTKLIKDRVNFIADVKIYAGEDEVKALALGVLEVLKDEVKPKIYK